MKNTTFFRSATLCALLGAASAFASACDDDDEPARGKSIYCFKCETTIVKENMITSIVTYRNTTTTNPCELSIEEAKELERQNSSRKVEDGNTLTIQSTSCILQ
jgi:hypothetical protein